MSRRLDGVKTAHPVSAVKTRSQNPACSVRAMISPCRAGVKSQK